MKKAEVKKGKKKNVLKEYWPLYLMMLPALLYLLINNYIPMAGMVIAFKKLNFAKGIWASPWAATPTMTKPPLSRCTVYRARTRKPSATMPQRWPRWMRLAPGQIFCA